MPTTVNVNGAGYSLNVGGATGSITTGMFNLVTITTPATGSTLTIANGKTLTASNTVILAGTDGSTLNIGTGGTLAALAYVATVGTALGYTAANDASVLHTTGNETKSGNLTLSGTGIYTGKGLSLSDTGWSITESGTGLVIDADASLGTFPLTIKSGGVLLMQTDYLGAWVVRGSGIILRTRDNSAPASMTVGIKSGAADPTISDIGTSVGSWWKNTTSGEIRYWYNDASTMKKSAALT